MKILKFFVVVICAVLVLRLAACTTGLSPAPQESTPTANPLPQHQQQQIQPQGGGDETPQPVVDTAQARDAALAYVLEHYPEAAAPGDNPLNLQWQVQDLTPSQTVGTSVTGYSSGDWQITVSYPVVLPSLVQYQVQIENQATGFSWSGILDANFNVLPQ
jgi:hypothetical protein